MIGLYFGTALFIMKEEIAVKEYYLSELLELKYGKDHKTLGNGTIPCYGSGGVIRYVNNSLYEKESILIPRKGSLNNLFFINKPFWTVDTLFWSIINEKIVLPRYLFYKLKNLNLSSFNEGSAVPSLTTKTLNKISIKIHNLQLQERIISILSSLDDKIELNKKINQNLEEIAQTLFKRWFIDFEFPNEEGKPYKSSGGKMSESELEEIPVGWRVAKLGDFIKFIKGKKPKILVEKEDGINKFKYLTIKSINNEEENYCSDEKVIFVSKNEIMMVMDGASSGDIYIGKEGVLGSTLSKIEIDKSIDWSIVYYLLNYYKNEIKQHNTGSAIPHTDKNYIENITFFLPNNKKINYFSKIFKSILLKKIALEDEIYKLIELRDYLLPRLMSGEIDISNLKISEISNSDKFN